MDGCFQPSIFSFRINFQGCIVSTSEIPTDVVFWDDLANEPTEDFKVICRFLVEAGACVADPHMLRYF